MLFSRMRLKLYWRLWKTVKANYGYYVYALRRRQSTRIRKILKQGCMPSAGSYFPTKLNLRLLYECNLRCKMCGQWGQNGSYFAYDKSRRRQRLDVEVIDRILAELIPRGLKMVDMEGGETLLYPPFEELLYRMCKRNLYVKFVTNGTLLDKFARPIVESSVQCVTVSLDGSREIHNRIRGEEWAYDRTMQGLSALSEMKKKLGKSIPLVQIAFTMNRHNGATALRNLCQDLRGKGLADVLAIKLTPIFVPVEAEKKYMDLVRHYFDVEEGIASPGGFRDDYSDFAEEGDKVVSTLSHLKKTPFDLLIEPLPHIPFIQIPRLYLDYSWDLGRGPCPVPFDEPTVDADGNVYPCNLFTDAPLSMGNVYQTSFLEIWQGSHFTKFRKMLMDQGGLLPICNRCCQLTEF
jgi:radical SAM protein with 4Fe4S-binding SPASM domain